MSTGAVAAHSGRLAFLMNLLADDPDNLALTSDAALMAFDERSFEQCLTLIENFAAKGPLPPELRNLQGSAAIALQKYDIAVEALSCLRSEGVDDPAIRFNLAWAYAMKGEYPKASALLDPASIACSPHGPTLQVEMLHHQGNLDHALEVGKELAGQYPEDRKLMSALAVLAMDADDLALAKDYANRAGDEPRGQAVQGMFDLESMQVHQALRRFEDALTRQPDNARAWVGKGLALLAAGEHEQAATSLDKGAQLFDSHQGSWIAAGWAHFLRGDPEGARTAFTRSLAIDPNFSESHGGLAVIDAWEGKTEDAKHNADVALRLDPQSLGGTLATTILLEKDGQGEAAQRLRQIAMVGKIGPNGETLGQLLVRLNAR